jgi:GT2 family glycosyltransferase
MNSEKPLVSIITVNYNQASLTCELLESLHKLTYKNTEIIVVDNASNIEDPSVIEHQFSRIKLIRSPRNLGFAGATNLGISIARGCYLFLIENNTEVPEDFLDPLVTFLKENPEAGMVSPKIKYVKQTGTIAFAGYTPMHKIKVTNHIIGFQTIDNGQHNTIIEIPYGHRAAMVVPSEIVKQVGLMPDIYILYFEEFDWAERIKEAGFKVFYYPNSFVYHNESLVKEKQSPLMVYYENRNQILFTRRNYKGMQKVIALFYLYHISVPKQFFKHLIRGQFQQSLAIIKSVWWNLVNFNIHAKCTL